MRTNARHAAAIRRGRRGRLRRQALLHGERQRIDGRDGLVEAQGKSGHVDEGHALQTIHVARDRFSQRNELRTVEPLQLGVGELQRSQCRRNVVRHLQLLAGELQHLVDLGQRPLVARRRELAIERLERGLLSLRFGLAAFEQRELGLRLAQALLRVLQGRALRLVRCVDVG